MSCAATIHDAEQIVQLKAVVEIYISAPGIRSLIYFLHEKYGRSGTSYGSCIVLASMPSVELKSRTSVFNILPDNAIKTLIRRVTI